jgi:hypothetical protein
MHEYFFHKMLLPVSIKVGLKGGRALSLRNPQAIKQDKQQHTRQGFFAGSGSDWKEEIEHHIKKF